MLWLKAAHIIAVVCWFAGIFYLPRILVYFAASEHPETRRQLAVMARRLYRFMSPIAVAAIVLGAALTLGNFGYYWSAPWFWLKLSAVLGLVVYHCICGRHVAAAGADAIRRGHVYFRLFNEIPVIFLLMSVILAVLKPF